MESTDLTIEILKDIRSQLSDQAKSTATFQTNQAAFNEAALQRFDAFETVLRDSNEHIVMLSRAIRTI